MVGFSRQLPSRNALSLPHRHAARPHAAGALGLQATVKGTAWPGRWRQVGEQTTRGWAMFERKDHEEQAFHRSVRGYRSPTLLVIAAWKLLPCQHLRHRERDAHSLDAANPEWMEPFACWPS